MPFADVAGPEDFAGPPARRRFVGRSFAFWQVDTRALGTVMWGVPSATDVEALFPFFELAADPRFAGHASFVDCRAVESVDVSALGRILAYLVARRHAWGPHVGRQAILHGDGLVGVVVSGALHVVRPPYPFACFHEDAAEAFRWCGVPDLRDEVESQCASYARSHEITQRVRAVLEERGLVSAADVAEALGTSQRTLQRWLAHAGTTFREQRDLYLSREIERRLAWTTLDLDVIATEVGLSSASHLVAHFRATHGTTPGAWRAEAARTLAPRASADREP